MKKYVIIASLIIIALFFYPKENNRWNDSFTAAEEGEYRNIDCECIGLIALKEGLSRSDAQIILCYGFPISCEYSCIKEINFTWQEIECEE